jgi:hypothetical protein
MRLKKSLTSAVMILSMGLMMSVRLDKMSRSAITSSSSEILIPPLKIVGELAENGWIWRWRGLLDLA